MDQQTVTGIHMPRIGAPLADGIFAGIGRGVKEGDPDFALVDLGLSDKDMTYANAGKYAAERGASRPTREEARILWANLDKRTGESRGWFWLDEQYEGFDGYAWYQTFYNGYQSLYRKDGELRARAVRRLPLLPFITSSAE